MKIFLAIFLAGIHFHPVSAQPETNASNEKRLAFTDLFRTQTQKDPACYRIPVLVTAPNGDILAAVDERVHTCGDLKWNEDINVVIRRSTDHGKTWSPIRKVVDYPPGQSASDPSVIVDKVTGEILLFFNYMDLYQERDVYYFKVIRSSDNGETWSAPEDITAQITHAEWKNDFQFITSGGGIQTQTGKLVHTLVNLQKGLHIFASDDHGRSWYVLETPLIPGDESKIVELADGRWMVNSRVNGQGCRHVHISTDEGKSWRSHMDSTLFDPGCNASLIRCDARNAGTDENLLLFANPNNRSDRKNMSLRYSEDGGKTWSAGKTVYAGSAAYSSMAVLPSGDIGVLFEMDDYRRVVFLEIPAKWLKGY